MPKKNLITAYLAIAAFAAFVIAPAASATTLTENGSAVGVGASFTGTADLIGFVTTSNIITCTSADMSGTVTANASGTFAIEIAAGNPVIKGSGSSEDCTSENFGAIKPVVNSKLCVHVAKGTDFATVTGCSTNPVTFSLAITSIGLNCRYSTAQIGAEVITAPRDAGIEVFSDELIRREENLFCPELASIELQLTLTTTNKATFTFS